MKMSSQTFQKVTDSQYVLVEDVCSVPITDLSNPYPNLGPIHNLGPTIEFDDIQKLLWHYAFYAVSPLNKWSWNWHEQFRIKKTINFSGAFCISQSTVSQTDAPRCCETCPINKHPSCYEIYRAYDKLLNYGLIKEFKILAETMRDFWQDINKSKYLISKNLGKMEAMCSTMSITTKE